jgi:serine/threonine protein kinase
MADEDSTLVRDAAIEQSRRIDEICSQFEEQWQAGKSPRIEDALERLPPAARHRGFVHLIAVELELRQTGGDAIDAERYVARFPNERNLVLEAFEGANGEFDPPKSLGRYQLRELLGRGSFGAVYLAFDPDLNREVALKVFRTRRFEGVDKSKERIHDLYAARLKHPGIVSIYDVSDEGGWTFIVQEYMPGGDLKARLGKPNEPISDKKAAEWMIQICEAVAYLHENKISHRDLKPANILLDKDMHPRVADFGLSLHEKEQHSRRHEFAGSVAYMSPERVSCHPYSPGRSDIWSLGIIFYELLAGCTPFADGERTALIEKIKENNHAPLRQLESTRPGAFDEICEKCLKTSPQDRYATARDIAKDLRRWQRGPWRHAVRMLLTAALLWIVGVFFGYLLTALGSHDKPHWSVAKIDGYGRVLLKKQVLSTTDGAVGIRNLPSSVVDELKGAFDRSPTDMPHDRLLFDEGIQITYIGQNVGIKVTSVDGIMPQQRDSVVLRSGSFVPDSTVKMWAILSKREQNGELLPVGSDWGALMSSSKDWNSVELRLEGTKGIRTGDRFSILIVSMYERHLDLNKKIHPWTGVLHRLVDPGKGKSAYVFMTESKEEALAINRDVYYLEPDGALSPLSHPRLVDLETESLKRAEELRKRLPPAGARGAWAPQWRFVETPASGSHKYGDNGSGQKVPSRRARQPTDEELKQCDKCLEDYLHTDRLKSDNPEHRARRFGFTVDYGDEDALRSSFHTKNIIIFLSMPD